MRKVILLITSLCILVMTNGCTTSEKVEKKEKDVKSIYCASCSEESKEVTKFCSKCGAEAKWLAEKPEKKEDEESLDKNENSNTKEEVNIEVKQHSYKNEYINKLNLIEESMSDLDYLYESGVTIDLVEAEGIRIKRWDDMLNEIYALLKVQLTEREMKELKNKQLNWIKYRDKTADNEAYAESGGGSLYNVVYNGSLARLTKERCYELVNIYMK